MTVVTTLSNLANRAKTCSAKARSYVANLSGAARSTLKLVAGSAGVGLLAAAVAIAAAGPWQSGQRAAERSWAAAQERVDRAIAAETHVSGAPSAPAVLAGIDPAGSASSSAPAGGAGAPIPTAQGLGKALGPLFNDPALGGVRTGAVFDAATGRQLFGNQADTPSPPASTTKIATAVAALEALGPDYTIPTTVAPGPNPGSIVLVGGGDPTLTAAAPTPGADPSTQPAALPALADATAKTLRQRGATRVQLTYDTSRYSGPVLHPIGVNDNIAPVTALMTDEGRVDPNSTENAPRVTDPAASAAQAFAGLLRARGIDVTGNPQPGARPGGKAQIAEVRSMPLSALVERMLTNSDNDIAEALARQAAIGTGQPVSFSGGAQAVTRTLARLGLPLGGTSFHDGSGLDRDDRVTADLLGRLLVTAADSAHPELRPVIEGLPIAGFTGTLSDRFNASEENGGRTAPGASGGNAAAAAGLVHAKTGTLTGVNTLAGTVVDSDGRLLVFAFMTSGAADPDAAVGALDRLATAVTGCGCR